MQKDGNLPLNIAEYDRQGRLIFHHYKQYVGDYWPGHYLTMITAHVYEGERLVRTYELHSNVGFTITDYKYGWLGWRVRAYIRHDSYDLKQQEINTNPYRYINQIQSLSQLLAHPQVQLLDRRGTKHLAQEWIYGLDKQSHQVVFWNEKGSAEGKAIRSYNAQQQLVREVILENDEKPSQTLELTYDQDHRLRQGLVLGDKQDTSRLHIYEYTPEGRIRNDFTFSSHFHYGRPEEGAVDDFYKTTYQYLPRGLVAKETVSSQVVNQVCGLTCEGQVQVETVYHHNTEGYVQEKVIQDYLENERTRKIYRYSYDYWPH
jgi:hypothetical protein